MVKAFLFLALLSLCFSAELVSSNQAGGVGIGEGQFRCPSGLAAMNDSVLVVDMNNRRVQRFTANLSFEYSFKDIKDEDGNIGQMQAPTRVAFDNVHNVIYVADPENDVIYGFDLQGRYQRTIGGFGKAGARFNGLAGLAVDAFGFLYIADRGNHRILKMDSEAKLLLEIPAKEGALLNPVDVDIDLATGKIIVLDTQGVKVYDEFGKFQRLWATVSHGKAITLANNKRIFVLTDNRIEGFDHEGQSILSDRPIKKPEDILWMNDHLFVSESHTHRILRFDVKD